MNQNAIAGARILLPTFGSLGDIHPFLALALELKSRGHLPIIATSEIYRPKIEAAGVGFHPIAPQLPPRAEWNDYLPRLMDGRNGTYRLFREILMPSLRQSYFDLLPALREADFMVAHSIVHAAPLCAETLGKKWLSVNLAPLAFWSVHDWPRAPGVPAYAKLRENISFLETLKGIIEFISARWVREVPQLRRELGLPVGAHPLFAGAHSPHGVLALFSRELAEPQSDWPVPTFQPGTCFYDRKGDFFGDAEYSGAIAPARLLRPSKNFYKPAKRRLFSRSARRRFLRRAIFTWRLSKPRAA